MYPRRHDIGHSFLPGSGAPVSATALPGRSSKQVWSGSKLTKLKQFRLKKFTQKLLMLHVEKKDLVYRFKFGMQMYNTYFDVHIVYKYIHTISCIYNTSYNIYTYPPTPNRKMEWRQTCSTFLGLQNITGSRTAVPKPHGSTLESWNHQQHHLLGIQKMTHNSNKKGQLPSNWPIKTLKRWHVLENHGNFPEALFFLFFLWWTRKLPWLKVNCS